MDDEYHSNYIFIIAYLIGLFCYVALGLIGTIILIIIIFLTTSWVYYDAKDLGAGRAEESWSPLTIALLVLLFWIIALPIYILRRHHIFETAKNPSKLSNQPSLNWKQAIKIVGFILILVTVLIIGSAIVAAFIFGMTGNIGTIKTIETTTPPTPTVVSSTDGDQIALAKMSEMTTWMAPTMNVIGDSLMDGDLLKAGINAALLRLYIDKNLPEMRQLANGATTKKAAALEYVAFLEDMRSASDKIVQAVDKFNSGDYTDSTRIMESGTLDTKMATAHLKRSSALL